MDNVQKHNICIMQSLRFLKRFVEIFSHEVCRTRSTIQETIHNYA
jgi:hypothetical protein